MNRKEIDEAILNAIAILKQENRPLTPVNIQDVSDVKLRLYQIYSSKLKDQLEIRGTKPKEEPIRIAEAIPKPVATSNAQAIADPRVKTADIDLATMPARPVWADAFSGPSWTAEAINARAKKRLAAHRLRQAGL